MRKATIISLCAALLLLGTTCEDEMETNCSPNSSISTSQGSAYIGCEIEPFYISLDSLQFCTVEMPIDSIHSENWVHGCSIEELSVDSSFADLMLTYLQSGELTLEPLVSSVSVEIEPLIISGEVIDAEELPYYGSLLIQKESQQVHFFMLNRYIGGCFHDELIWKVIQ